MHSHGNRGNEKSLGLILTVLMTVIQNWSKVVKCFNSGLLVVIAGTAFLVQMTTYIAFMTNLLVMPFGVVTGYLFSFAMETMMLDASKILNICEA
mgnify:CR=1 FL=1